MRTGGRVTLAALACALAAAACEPPGGGARELTAADNGAGVHLRLGQELRVKLEEAPTTGYRWETEYVDEAVLRFEGREFERDPRCLPGMVGCGGTATLKYTAAEVGRTVLRLLNRRAWETTWVGVFEVTVVVGR